MKIPLQSSLSFVLAGAGEKIEADVAVDAGGATASFKSSLFASANEINVSIITAHLSQFLTWPYSLDIA